MNLISTAFAMGGAPDAQQAAVQGPAAVLMQFLPLVLIFVIFYFLLIRPQQKRAKEHQNFLDNLKKGDEVTTAGGIIGRITGLTDQVVTIEVAENTRIKVMRLNIAGPGPAKTDKEVK
ncbi:MAG: preprotein translocase subunit YajC [Dissulfuribacterales bacterium]